MAGTVDVQAFDPQLDGFAIQKLTDATVEGPAKVAQNAIIELMEIRGSTLYAPERGSRFLPYLMATAANERDVFVAFAVGRADVLNNLKALITADTPLDERIADMELLQIAITGAGVVMQIAVTTQAGGVVTRALPLNFRL